MDKFIKNERYELYNYDCIEMMDLLIAEGKQVDLTVTSPPYDDLRDYENSLVWNFDVFKQVADRLYKITKDGGIVVWIVNDKTKNGSETLTSFRQALYFKEIGFKLHDTMIYAKNNPTPQKSNRYQSSFEYMFIFSKGRPNTFNPILEDKKYIEDRKNKQYNKKQDGTQVVRAYTSTSNKKVKSNIWTYSVGLHHSTTDKFAFKHPAIFPEKLAQDHILSWSNEGDIVLDCFMGSCTTGKMALLNNRKFIGIEKVEEYFEISIERIKDL